MEPSLLKRRAETLVRALENDPISTWLFPDPVSRVEQLGRVFQGSLGYAEENGTVDSVNDTDAVAAWARPGCTSMSLGAMIRHGLMGIGFRAGLRGTLKILETQNQIDALHKRSISEPHWYVMALGVRPDKQGGGLGSQVLIQGVQRAKAEGRAVYLESTNPRNLPFYERNGFRLVGRQVVEPGKLTVFGMQCG